MQEADHGRPVARLGGAVAGHLRLVLDRLGEHGGVALLFAADVAEVEEEITEATEELIIEETAPEEVTEKSEELVIEETAPENAAEKPEAAVEASSAGNTYVVKRGDTLAKISWKFYQTADMVDEICELNQIENRDIILYGKEILLP